MLEAHSSNHVRVKQLVSISHRHATYPVYALSMGNPSPETPTLTFIAGIHGLEKIGSEVVLAFLDTLIQRLEWDQSLITGLKSAAFILSLSLIQSAA